MPRVSMYMMSGDSEAPGRPARGIGVAFLLLAAALVFAHPPSALATTLQQADAVQAAAATGDQLYLELVINSVATGKIVPVLNSGKQFFVSIDDLKQAGLPLATSYEQVDVAGLPRVKTEYDSNNQRLVLTVPPSWLPEQKIGSDKAYERNKPVSSLGAVVNYDVYTSDTEQGTSQTSAWTEVRAFGDKGVVSSTGVYSQTYSGEQSQPNHYVRYDTTWSLSDDESMRTYELGDYISRSLAWGSSARLGGVQVSRDFSVRPDVITYPLPRFQGEAAVPTSVDLFINGYKASSSQVDPGPFTLTNVPFINGAGEAVVVTTDALGRQVSTTVPFYVSSQLLGQGLSDYALSAGALRKEYGSDSFAYGASAGSGSYRYGVTDFFTLEAQGEVAKDLTQGGLGGVLALGNYGNLNLSGSHSDGPDGRGGQVSYGYRYNTRSFSLSAQQMLRDRGFSNLSVYESDLFGLSKKSSQVTGSVSLNRFGNLGGGYFDVEASDGSRTRLVNLSWSKPLWYDSSFYLSMNRDLGERGWGSTAQLVVPFDMLGTVSSSLEHTQDGRDNQRVNYSRSVPSQGGLGWNLGYANNEGGHGYRQFDATWRSAHTQLQAGTFGSETQTRWADLSGSLVLMNGTLYPANRINDAFVLVSTDGQEGVPVRYENQLVGKTDASGHLLVPWASSYYAGKYEVDPLELPANMEVAKVEQRVALKSGSGYLMRFPMKRMVAANIILVDDNGVVLPVGSYVTAANSPAAYVGWDGLVYMEGLAVSNKLLVRLPDDKTCRASFRLDAQGDQIAQVGPLTCRGD